MTARDPRQEPTSQPAPAPVPVPGPATPPTRAERRLAGHVLVGAGAAAAGAAVFVLLWLLVSQEVGWLRALDRGTADAAVEALRGTPAVPALRVVSVGTEPFVLRAGVLVVVVLLWRRGLRRQALWLGLVVAVAGVLGAVLKLVVGRERPAPPDPLATAPGASFPSGHALTSMLVAAALLVLVWPRLRGGRRAVALVVAAAFVLLVAADRVLLAVHYVSDVAAAWAVALALLAAAVAAAGGPARASLPARGALGGPPTRVVAGSRAPAAPSRGDARVRGASDPGGRP